MTNGTLTLCGTPIGNLEDITLRALRILKEVDLIAAEDTRHTLKLLNFYGISRPLTSYHQHNRFEKGPKLVKLLQEGKNIALVTDAGMPGISDPGFDLVKLCREAGIPVTAAPGPTAAVTALVLSGLSADGFVFLGFLPKEKKERKKIMEDLRRETRTTVLYEAPHRLTNTLEALEAVLGDRLVCAARELTKKHEEAITMPTNALKNHFMEHEPRGEFVLVIEGTSLQIEEQEALPIDFGKLSPAEHVEYYMTQGHDKKTAMKLCARDLGISKSDVYKALLRP